MTAQSEQALENGLIATLKDMSYEYVELKEETNLYANFKKRLRSIMPKSWLPSERLNLPIRSLKESASTLRVALCSRSPRNSVTCSLWRQRTANVYG